MPARAMDVMERNPVAEFDEVDLQRFRDEIRPSGQPAVLRGHAADWPAVCAARQSDEALVDYLMRFAVDDRVQALVGEPEIEGRFFYSPDLRGFNFKRGLSRLEPFLQRLLRDRAESRPLAMAVQSEPIPDLLPGFESDNRSALVAPEVVPRAWIGNRIRVAPHFDLKENIGIVVAGRRRFTLFPPEQLPNLYPGPFELTPAGTRVSMVDCENPDLDLYPKFAEAMKSARVVELSPGDAIYIPFHWWHGVDSLEPFNLFVNYWWNEAPSNIGSPYDALMYGFFGLKHLPPEQRAVWREVFDHYVFCTNGDPAEHLPEHARGVLGKPTPQLLGWMRATLKRILEHL
ncbi:MAG TPA: cupin-like domain-containing protein [Sphingomicrobium sp.]|nr:cupin-like domain-containing protein [Sphingomicrobium sp.]